jgi:hypothetical protein
MQLDAGSRMHVFEQIPSYGANVEVRPWSRPIPNQLPARASVTP